MKRHLASAKLLASLTVVLGLALAAAGQGGPERTAKVIRMKGFARYTTGHFVWQPIKVGTVLQSGVVIQTSADAGSYLDLVLGDSSATVPQPRIYQPHISDSMASWKTSFRPTAEQNALRIWGDSALAINKLNAVQTGADLVSETELDLKRGRITANVKKLSAASRYEVKFGNGIARVRGTVFDIRATGFVKVFVGSVVVAWVDPFTRKVVTQIVSGGQVYDAPNRLVSLLSPESMGELRQIAGTLILGPTLPMETTLAADRTVESLSPVGAEPGSVSGTVNRGGGPNETGVVFTFHRGP